jgi:hypothetical protein
MPSHENTLLQKASEYWQGGMPLEAGRLIFENMPSNARPRWAARILSLVLARSGIQSPLFEGVLQTAEREDLWRNGHRVFSTLRASTLKLDDMERTRGLTQNQQDLRYVLSLAELVAKVTYNATNPLDEFDEDSGWWLAACLRGFVDAWSDDEFSKAAWSALCARE